MGKGPQTVFAVCAGLGVLGAVAYGGASLSGSMRLARSYQPHDVKIPVPIPLSEDEVAALRAERQAALPAPTPAPVDPSTSPDGQPVDGVAADLAAMLAAPVQVDVLADVDLDAIALSRARDRGKHLVQARFACIECHGADFTGGTMVDDGAMGTWLGPNLTGGEGSPVKDYTISDWDHIVRHGVKKNGRPAVMPSDDYLGMSDRELSDIVAYIQSFEPVDKTIPAPTFGPIGTILLANKALPLSAESSANVLDHPAEPPPSENTVAFGEHLSQVCTGCHNADLAGGTIKVGPPSWPYSANLTPHESGLKGWTFEQFQTAMIDGKRPDGTELRDPMNVMKPYAANMTEVERRALFTYLQSLPPTPKGD